MFQFETKQAAFGQRWFGGVLRTALAVALVGIALASGALACMP
jgi:hypothetical protein